MDATALRQQFRESYPEAGEPFVCRAPGRVNLIGEHMDYNGLPVLPMAIDQEIQLAFTGNTTGSIRLRNACISSAAACCRVSWLRWALRVPNKSKVLIFRYTYYKNR